MNDKKKDNILDETIEQPDWLGWDAETLSHTFDHFNELVVRQMAMFESLGIVPATDPFSQARSLAVFELIKRLFPLGHERLEYLFIKILHEINEEMLTSARSNSRLAVPNMGGLILPSN